MRGFWQPPSENDLVGKAPAQLLVWQNNRVQDEHLSRDPDAAACSMDEGRAPEEAMGRGSQRQGAGGHCHQEGSLLPICALAPCSQ